MSQSEILLSVDAAVFGYDPRMGLSVLLIRRKYDPYKGQWAIPGGMVEADESLERAVERELMEETGISVNYMEQLYTFGQPGRDPRSRVVTVAYYALVNSSKFELHAASDAEDARWFKIDDLPDLAFDHAGILRVALDRIKAKISYEPIGFELLDDKFPFSALHKLYETVKGERLDRRNFKKKMLQLGLLVELDEKVSRGKGRPGSLFRFNEEKYQELKAQGAAFEV